MRKVVAPKQSRLDVAKAALEEVIQALPSGSDIQIALRVYGAGLMPDEPCKDSVLVQPFGTVEAGRQGILEFVRGLRPKGMTPIGYSLQQAGKDFSTAGTRNVIVLLTDGAESCRVDPCLISQQLQAQGIIVEPYVIGFDMTPDEEALVACIGKYYSANDLDSLKRALSSIMAEAVAPTQIGVTTLAQGKNVTERAVIEILDSGGRVIQAKRGSPNLKELVFSLSPGVYTARATLEVGSELIPAEKQSIQLTEGQVIQATLDFGDLAGKVSVISSAGASDVSAGVTIEVLDRGAIVGPPWQGIPPTTVLPAGTYTFLVRGSTLIPRNQTSV